MTYQPTEWEWDIQADRAKGVVRIKRMSFWDDGNGNKHRIQSVSLNLPVKLILEEDLLGRMERAAEWVQEVEFNPQTKDF